MTTARRALVSVVLAADVFELFVRQVETTTPRRVEIVSPWAGDGTDLGRLTRLIQHLSRHKARLLLTTRHPDDEAHRAFIAAVQAYERGTVVYSRDLHAKLFVSIEARRGGLAIIGSANASEGSRRLLESAVLVRPLGRSKVVTDLATVAASLADVPEARRGKSSISNGRSDLYEPS
jgi:hypothetical protein